MPPKKGKKEPKSPEAASPREDKVVPSVPEAKAKVKRALILVGGYGTRLRPLTFSHAKPLVPFANKAIVLHQVEALVKCGVKEIILAVNYKPQDMVDYLTVAEAKLGIKIIISKEEEPLGTAGPIALAKKYLTSDETPFFMFNSDVICEFPLQDMINFHIGHGKEGTLMVTQVEDPSKYGVILSESNGEIKAFYEKPKEYVSDKINAGIYLLNPSIVRRIEPRPTSIEREIFPVMAAEKQLYSMVLPGYWMDIGQPKDFLTGSVLHLKSLRQHSPDNLVKELKDSKIIGNVFMDPTARVGRGCVIGPDVVIGANCVIEDGCRIKRVCLFEGSYVKTSAYIFSSIIGWQSRIGAWSRVENCVMGLDCEVGDEIHLNEVTICPHKGVRESTSKQVLM